MANPSLTLKTVVLIALTLIFFASNSILCRLALANKSIDAYSFTLIRLVSGAVVLNLIAFWLGKWKFGFTGNIKAAGALLAYALFFSIAYLKLPASTGALILFGSVQATMIGWSMKVGLGPNKNEMVGLALALGGLIYLLLPGVKAPNLLGALCMFLSGIGWGVYSILGKKSTNPISNTAGNFLLASILSIILMPIILHQHKISAHGIFLACISGAVSSGIGYSIWYTVLPKIKSTQAAIVQLLVPALAALFGTILLSENIPARLIVAGAAISLGVLVAVMKPIKISR